MKLAHKGIYLDNSALSPDNSVKLYFIPAHMWSQLFLILILPSKTIYSETSWGHVFVHLCSI